MVLWELPGWIPRFGGVSVRTHAHTPKSGPLHAESQRARIFLVSKWSWFSHKPEFQTPAATGRATANAFLLVYQFETNTWGAANRAFFRGKPSMGIAADRANIVFLAGWFRAQGPRGLVIELLVNFLNFPRPAE